MKRKTAMALAAVFAMSVAGTALAAPANPSSTFRQITGRMAL